jgi:hypothetical protein
MVEILEWIQDFFGLNETGSILVLALVVAGFFLSIGGSRALVFQDSDKGMGKFTIAMLALTAVAGTVCIVPGFVLLITFKWNKLLTAVLLAAAVVAPLFWLVYTLTFRLRMAKYMRNPVMKEVLAFARQHDVAGIQCFVDGVRFYSALENADYCKREAKTVNQYSFSAFTAAQADPPRPTGFDDYIKSGNSLGILRFSDRGYPNLPDVSFFGKVLAKKLEGYESAYHSVTLTYDESSANKIVHNICRVHEDAFVYKKSALVPIRVANNRSKRAAAAAAKKQERQAKKWE